MTTATLPDLDGFTDCFGILVSEIGDDGDMIALGHHDPRHTLAAFNAHARQVCGMTDLLDGDGRHHARRWEACRDSIATTCAVQLTDGCADAATGGCDDDCPTCAAVRATVADGSWWLDINPPAGTPGTFPVMHLSR